MENKKNEELQSRRDFFKKAAKAALPVIGAIVLAGAPSIVKAAEKAPMGCELSCSARCAGNCHGQCVTTCRGRCDTTCSGNCDGGCKFTCSGGCKNGNNRY